MIRVLLVDDQELIRSGLRAILREPFGFQVVGECRHGGEVAGAVAVLAPDVVVMDARMPVLDGIEATRRLRAQADENVPPVLALTTFDDDDVLAGMLRAGAAGFVLKGVPAEDLQRAVRTVAEGGSWLDPAVTGRVLSVFRDTPAEAVDHPAVAALTARERDVLELIAAGLTNDEIAEQLVLGAGTIKTHINHLFFKLEVRNRAEAVIFAFDHGLVRPGRQ